MPELRDKSVAQGHFRPGVHDSGCVLLPGIPYLGLDHRAGWVEAEADGTVTRLLSRVSVDLGEDPDIAVLATLCA